MPTYEYECEACGAHEEHVQPISEAPKRTCAACGKSSLVRVISAAPFLLKGGGWYRDGYSSSRSGSSSTKSSSSESSSGSSSPSGASKGAEASGGGSKKDD
jgi:putative FmdB family regulatory protein